MLDQVLKFSTAAFYMIGGPSIHILLITQKRELYSAVDDQAIALYEKLWNTMVLPNLVPLVILLMVLEFVAGVMMFSTQRVWAASGQLSGLLFNLLLLPFWFFMGIPNLLMALLHLWLLRRELRMPHSQWRPPSMVATKRSEPCPMLHSLR